MQIPSPDRTARAGVVAFRNECEVIEWSEVEPVGVVSPLDFNIVIPVRSDVLAGDDITDGDLLLARINYSKDEITPGRLCYVITPLGSVILHIYRTWGSSVRLVPSNSDYESLLFHESQVLILGVIVGHVRKR